MDIDAWSFFAQDTGVFTGDVRLCSAAAAAAYALAAGQAFTRGTHDPLSRRVDISAQPPPDPDPWPTDAQGIPLPREPWYPPVIDYQHPAPPDDDLKTWAWAADIKRWVASRTLKAVKLDQWAQVKAHAAALDIAPLTVQGNDFLTDAATRAAMAWRLALARELIADGGTPSIEWPRADDTDMTLNFAQFRALVRAIDNRSTDLRATAQSLRAQIVAASTAAEVAAITWD